MPKTHGVIITLFVDENSKERTMLTFQKNGGKLLCRDGQKKEISHLHAGSDFYFLIEVSGISQGSSTCGE